MIIKRQKEFTKKRILVKRGKQLVEKAKVIAKERNLAWKTGTDSEVADFLGDLAKKNGKKKSAKYIKSYKDSLNKKAEKGLRHSYGDYNRLGSGKKNRKITIAKETALQKANPGKNDLYLGIPYEHHKLVPSGKIENQAEKKLYDSIKRIK